MARNADRPKSKSYGLGVGHGSMIDNGDGTVSYRPTGKFMDVFRVRVADISGFSQEKSRKALERMIIIYGSGTTLASASVNHGTPERIEAWIRERPDFRGAQAVRTEDTPPPSASVADELMKLAQLRDSGVLTEQEFAAQKAKLLGNA
jgi:Short C-terminal domain